MSAPIQIVDEDDNPLRPGTREEAQKLGLYHRIARVIVEDQDGNILLQKRASTKDTYPGYWDNAAAGHVDAGESYEVAAARELQEELGIRADMTLLGNYAKNSAYEDKLLNRFHAVYKVVVPSATKFVLQTEEVDEVRWFSLAEINQMIFDPDVKVTNGVRDAINMFYQDAGV